MANNGGNGRGPRCIALVGPFQSGKTTLLEAILARTNTIQRQGTVEAGTTVGDASKEARHHKMSVEVTVATASFMGDDYTFIDCPGSVEFVHEMRAVLPAIDAAVVVCEADERKVSQLQLILRELEELKIPRFLFLNKIDKADQRVRETLKLLQPASRVPLLLRQIPIWKNDIITGFVDLALERAFVYKEHVPSEVIPLEGDDLSRGKDARFSMLETLADHDDELMEQLLEDIPPPRDKVFDDLAKEQRDGLICPVLIGVATRTNGVLRLLKALRHESRGIDATAKRLGITGNDPVAYVLKTFHTAHGGKMSVARVLSGQIGDGTTLSSPTEEAGRVSGVLKLVGQVTEKRGAASAGETVALGKLDHARTGDTLSAGKQVHKAVARVEPFAPVLAIAVSAKDRKDDVKLGMAFNKLHDEDPSLVVHHNPETHEVVVWGQGEMHLRVATERLADRYGVSIERRTPSVGYRETIRKPIAAVRGRHKKQSGGHGQFGDVVLDIKPLPRGSGFTFDEKIVGGAVPRNYIPSVEEGVVDALKHGPLGFQVVDLAVSLVDGSYHAVDSSDMAFRIAGRIGINDALPQCNPVLLEPIHTVEIVCPTDATAKINAILSGRRGQILSFDTREGWSGWDVVRAMMPESEIGDLIIEVRSATAGVGSFTFKFDHMAELTGKPADQIVAARRAAAE
ncbi:MAG TPA: elongation factor G [Xanthobacteraceae bacterium]|nr:elongation factor G [Xanthobacteraceae bacterium]